jgi:polyisoprenoid-binding protein YceI
MKAVLLTAMMITGAMASAEVYKIDTTASKAEWLAGKKTGSTHNGEIKIKNGEVQTDKKGKVTSANIVVDMKTISNIDLKDSAEYQKKLVGHLASDDFFKVEQFPESTFKLTSITPKAGSKDEYVVKGELTMIGKTEAVEFPAKMTTDKNTLTGSAKLTIERLKWGLQYGSGSIFKTLTADKIINDTYDLTLTFVAKK